jgi:hypothetical protein
MAKPKSPKIEEQTFGPLRTEAGADESDEANQESESTLSTDGSLDTATDQPETEAAAQEDPKPKRSIHDRIKDIEKRWGKGWEEVLTDVHDHVFGTSNAHDADEKKTD